MKLLWSGQRSVHGGVSNLNVESRYAQADRGEVYAGNIQLIQLALPDSQLEPRAGRLVLGLSLQLQATAPPFLLGNALPH